MLGEDEGLSAHDKAVGAAPRGKPEKYAELKAFSGIV
jgi:hypothetical protein